MESNHVQQDNQRSGGPLIEFMKTTPGIIMLVNFIMLMICWCIMAVWRGRNAPFASSLESETGYFLFVTVFPWLVYIRFFVRISLRWNQPFGLASFIICVLWAFLLFVAACLIAHQSTGSPCYKYLCDQLKVAADFGFLTSIGLGLQACYHYNEYKVKSSENPTPTALNPTAGIVRV